MSSHQAGGVLAQITELHPAGKLRGNTAQCSTLVGDTDPVAEGSRESESRCKSHLLPAEQAPTDRLSLLPGDGNRSRGMKATRIADALVVLYLRMFRN